MYYVYRFWNIENEVIYVGRTGDLKSRLKAHFYKANKEMIIRNRETIRIDYCEFKSEVHGCIYEIQLIDFHKPKYNKEFVYGDESSVSLVELDVLTFKVIPTDYLNKLKSNNKKKVSKSKISKLTEVSLQTSDFYVKKYNLTPEEAYVVTVFHKYSFTGYLGTLSRECNINKVAILETLNKFIRMGLVEAICLKGTSFNKEDEAYVLLDTEGFPDDY